MGVSGESARSASRAVFLFVALSLVALVSSDADAEEAAIGEHTAAQVDNGAPTVMARPSPPPAPRIRPKRTEARQRLSRGRVGIRFSAEMSPLLAEAGADSRRPCEAHARNVPDEPALHLQHAAVIPLRHKCRHAPPIAPGQTGHACAEPTNAVEIDMTHGEAPRRSGSCARAMGRRPSS